MLHGERDPLCDGQPLLLGAEVLPEALEVLAHARVQVLVVLGAAVAAADLSGNRNERLGDNPTSPRDSGSVGKPELYCPDFLLQHAFILSHNQIS